MSAAIAVTAIVITVAALGDGAMYSPDIRKNIQLKRFQLPELPQNTRGGGLVGGVGGIADLMGP